MPRFWRGYDRVTAWFLRSRWIALGTLALLVAGAWVAYRIIGTDFLPHMDEGSIILDYWTPPGTSLTDTDEMLREAERVIQQLPDVVSYSRRTGAQLGFFITEPNRGDYVIKLKPQGARRDVDAVIEDLRTRIAGVEPAIHTDFGSCSRTTSGTSPAGPRNRSTSSCSATIRRCWPRRRGKSPRRLPGSPGSRTCSTGSSSRVRRCVSR
jgi:multidrug efflux pump subunit AcrB